MTPLLLIIFGSLSGTLLSIFVGLLGSRRTIGFGWAFILSLIFTPFVGLIITLLSEPLPGGEYSRYGCVGGGLALFGLLCLIPFIWLLLVFFMLI